MKKFIITLAIIVAALTLVHINDKPTKVVILEKNGIERVHKGKRIKRMGAVKVEYLDGGKVRDMHLLKKRYDYYCVGDTICI